MSTRISIVNQQSRDFETRVGLPGDLSKNRPIGSMRAEGERGRAGSAPASRPPLIVGAAIARQTSRAVLEIRSGFVVFSRLPAMELQPHLTGELVELRPLQPEDWDGLFMAASDPLVWEQHPASDRYQEEIFREFFQGALDSKGAFAVIDRKACKIIGSSRYHYYAPDKSQIESGWTFLARAAFSLLPQPTGREVEPACA